MFCYSARAHIHAFAAVWSNISAGACARGRDLVCIMGEECST